MSAHILGKKTNRLLQEDRLGEYKCKCCGYKTESSIDILLHLDGCNAYHRYMNLPLPKEEPKIEQQKTKAAKRRRSKG